MMHLIDARSSPLSQRESASKNELMTVVRKYFVSGILLAMLYGFYVVVFKCTPTRRVLSLEGWTLL